MLRTILAIGILVFAPQAEAGPDECRDAIDEYNSALSDIDDALRGYSSCVKSRPGQRRLLIGI